MAVATFLHTIQAIQEEEKLIPGNHPTRRREVTQAIVDMVKSYSEQNFKSENPDTVDYNLPRYRCAYAYKYVTSHVRFVREYLWWAECHLMDMMQNRSQLHVCSIGGGPGSDLLGVKQFLGDTLWWGKRTITADIIDLHAYGWQHMYRQLRKRMDPNQNCIKDVAYSHFDFFDSSNLTYSKIASADLVTMIKFLSAVLNDKTRNTCQQILMKMIQNMKENALLYFIDNTGGGCLKLMLNVAKNCRLIQIVSTSYGNFQWATVETLDLYRNHFGNISPQFEGKLAVAIWRKPSTVLYSSPRPYILEINDREKFHINPQTISNYLDKSQLGMRNAGNLNSFAEIFLKSNWEKWRNVSASNLNANFSPSTETATLPYHNRNVSRTGAAVVNSSLRNQNDTLPKQPTISSLTQAQQSNVSRTGPAVVTSSHRNQNDTLPKQPTVHSVYPANQSKPTQNSRKYEIPSESGYQSRIRQYDYSTISRNNEHHQNLMSTSSYDSLYSGPYFTNTSRSFDPYFNISSLQSSNSRSHANSRSTTNVTPPVRQNRRESSQTENEDSNNCCCIIL